MIHKLILGNFNPASRQIREIYESMKQNPVLEAEIRQTLSENRFVKMSQNGKFYLANMRDDFEVEIREFIAIPLIKGNIFCQKSLELASFLSERFGLSLLLSPSKVLLKDELAKMLKS